MGVGIASDRIGIFVERLGMYDGMGIGNGDGSGVGILVGTEVLG